jgi:hypothetical protein
MVHGGDGTYPRSLTLLPAEKKSMDNDKPDWKEIDRAVYEVGQSYGHHTAHLSPADQIKAARNVILDMCDTIEQIASEADTATEPKP